MMSCLGGHLLVKVTRAIVPGMVANNLGRRKMKTETGTYTYPEAKHTGQLDCASLQPAQRGA